MKKAIIVLFVFLCLGTTLYAQSVGFGGYFFGDYENFVISEQGKNYYDSENMNRRMQGGGGYLFADMAVLMASVGFEYGDYHYKKESRFIADVFALDLGLYIKTASIVYPMFGINYSIPLFGGYKDSNYMRKR